MSAALRILKFIVSEFGPLIVFYAVNHFYGIKPAILSAVAFTILAIVYKYVKKEKFTPFFIFTVAVTLVFGALDLWLQTPTFFRYEAALTNFITGIYFGMTLFASKSFVHEFVEKQKGHPITEPNAIEAYRVFTVIWTAYFFAKGAYYVYLGMTRSLEDALFIRTTIGTSSFYFLLGLSLFFGKGVIRFLRTFGLMAPEVRK